MTETEAQQALEMLTPKHVEVLDLLAQHLTTKEIARRLGLAPTTVDQRISAIRERWGTTNRKATIRRYSDLLSACGKTTYSISSVDAGTWEVDLGSVDSEVDPIFSFAASCDVSVTDQLDELLRPDYGHLHRFDSKFGISGRVFIVAALAMMIALTLVAMLAIGRVIEGFVAP